MLRQIKLVWLLLFLTLTIIPANAQKFAVIKIQGHQYKIIEGDEILVDKINEDVPNADVLLVSDGDKVLVGKPVVKKASVKFKVLVKDEKGKKLTVRKYKAKSRYRKKIGLKLARVLLLRFRRSSFGLTYVRS